MAQVDTAADIAVVIPVHDDTPALALLLMTVEAWPMAPAELIVVAESDDVTLREACERRGWVFLVTPGTRGRRLDYAARSTNAAVLWFLHADTEPPADGLAAIAAAIASGASGGCFAFRFQGPRTWYKRLLEALIALRIRCGGVAYGDQGLFVSRGAYRDSGGFADQALFEEVGLVQALRSRGRFRALAEPIGVATRRWERDGWLRRTVQNRWLALRYALGTPPAELALAYRRGPRHGNVTRL